MTARREEHFKHVRIKEILKGINRANLAAAAIVNEFKNDFIISGGNF